METQIDIQVVLAILLIHWIADFIVQTDEQAKNKSKSNFYLTTHVLSYSAIWFSFVVWLLPSISSAVLFTAITFICHWITDYVTSRINSSLYAKNKIHLFFVSIGFDQWLHYAQLFLTFQFLS